MLKRKEELGVKERGTRKKERGTEKQEQGSRRKAGERRTKIQESALRKEGKDMENTVNSTPTEISGR
jgi:hypothetical protein